MSIEFGDQLLAERRHRVNAKASRKHRVIPHYRIIQMV